MSDFFDSVIKEMVRKNKILSKEQAVCFGKFVRKKLIDKDMTVKDLEIKISPSKTYAHNLSSTLNGHVRPTMKKVVKILKAVGSNIDELKSMDGFK